MFAAPPEIGTEVFARIPDHLRRPARLSRWAVVHRPGRVTDCFIEGPSFDHDGNLLLVEVAHGRILKVTPAGIVSVIAEYDGEPNGLKLHQDGRIFIADFRRGILLLDPATGEVETLLDGHEGAPFKGVNDLFFAANGDLYFTDQGLTGLQDPSGRLFRLRTDGRLELVLAGIPSPNGLVVEPDGRTVYVNVTRDNAVWRVPLLEDGRPFKVGAFVRLSGGVGPDGLARDRAGNLAIAHIGLGTVWLVDPRGEPIARIRSCAGDAVTNVAYGVVDPMALYITESETGQVLRALLPVPGETMFSHAASATSRQQPARSL